MNERKLDASWTPLALAAVDGLLDEEVLRTRPCRELRNIIAQTRNLLEQSDGEDSQIFGTVLLEWNRGTELLAEKTEKSEEIKAVVEETAERIRFLIDYFQFQKDGYFHQSKQNRTFIVQPASAFKRAHRAYRGQKTLAPSAMEEKFGYDYRALADAMGFPMILDTHDENEMRNKLTEDLWRMYNEKNKLPTDNRTYRPDTELPHIRESLYSIYYYEKAYFGFSEAVRIVIESSGEEKNEDEKIEPLSEKRLDELLRLSLSLDRKPDVKEEEMKAIRRMLKEDLEKTIRDWTVPVLRKGHRPVLFAIYHLLAESVYFGHYGARIYKIWFDRKELEKMTDHVYRRIRNLNRAIVFGEGKYGRLPIHQTPPLVHIPPEDIERFPKMSVPEIRAYVRDRLHCAIPRGVPLSRDHCAEVLTTWGENNISVPPEERYFTEPRSMLTTRDLRYLAETACFCDEMPDFPLFMRQFLLSKRSRAHVLRKRAAVYRQAKLPEKYYVYALHVPHTPCYTKGIIRGLRRAVKNAIRITAAREEKEDKERQRRDPEGIQARLIRELLAHHIPEEELPSEEDLRGNAYSTIANRIRKRKRLGRPITVDIVDEEEGIRSTAAFRKKRRKEDDEACRELARLEYPYESLHVANRPLRVLRKVKIMLETMGTVRRFLIEKSEEEIRRFAETHNAKKTERTDYERAVEKFCEERGIGPVPAYYHKNNPKFILERMRYIESRGVPFRGKDQWSWINFCLKNLDRKIDKAWNREHREEKWDVLCALYEIEKETLPACVLRFSPEYAWRYFRILSAAEVSPRDISLFGINTNFSRWRNMTADALPEKTSQKQDGFLARHCYGLAAEMDFGWKDAHNLTDCLADGELKEAERVLFEKKGSAKKLYKKLSARAQLREQNIKKLTQARASFADIEYFLDHVGDEEIAARMEIFEEASARIDIKLLYLSKEEIRERLSEK